MNCPTCPDSTLVMADRSGIEIDYCPACRGVWLDRGELDKIIERNAATMTPARAAVATARRDDRRDDDRYDVDRDDDHDDHRDDHRRDVAYPKKKKRSSFLGDIFEF